MSDISDRLTNAQDENKEPVDPDEAGEATKSTPVERQGSEPTTTEAGERELSGTGSEIETDAPADSTSGGGTQGGGTGSYGTTGGGVSGDGGSTPPGGAPTP